MTFMIILHFLKELRIVNKHFSVCIEQKRERDIKRKRGKERTRERGRENEREGDPNNLEGKH